MWLNAYKIGMLPGFIFGSLALLGVILIAITGRTAPGVSYFSTTAKLIVFGGIGTAVMWTFVFGPVLGVFYHVLQRYAPAAYPKAVFLALLVTLGVLIVITGGKAESPYHGGVTLVARWLPLVFGVSVPVLFYWLVPRAYVSM
jgi:hypothetical protein